VIGSKGENITQIQAQSGCRIQIAPDPANGNPNGERHVTLNGPAEAIQKAKELINGTMNESEGAMMGGRRGGAGGPDMSMSAGEELSGTLFLPGRQPTNEGRQSRKSLNVG